VVPRVLKNRMGARAFSYQAPLLWNQLPPSVWEADAVTSFKSRLKTFLFDSLIVRAESGWLWSSPQICCYRLISCWGTFSLLMDIFLIELVRAESGLPWSSPWIMLLYAYRLLGDVLGYTEHLLLFSLYFWMNFHLSIAHY